MFGEVEMPFTLVEIVASVFGFIGTLDRLILFALAITIAPILIAVIYKVMWKK